MNDVVLSRDQSRQIDRMAVAQLGFSSLVLMENAGRGVVDTLERLGVNGPIAVLCGKGNNAGDGFVVARHLLIRRHACRAMLLLPPGELTGDARTNYEILSKTDVPIHYCRNVPQHLDELAHGADWLVDAMLGTGALGNPRPPFDAAVEWFNRQPAKKLAVDVPSGLNCETGEPGLPTVCADHTCTFVATKRGYLAEGARNFTGQIHVLDIGIPLTLLAGLPLADLPHSEMSLTH
jgi:NAD(P)H-hydrate epimerase